MLSPWASGGQTMGWRKPEVPQLWAPHPEPGPWLRWTEQASGSMLSALPVLILSSANSCNHGKCVATGTSYVCKCVEGYSGATCDHKNDSNACSTFKCHQGQCHFSDRGEPYCLCQPGFSGEHCEQGGSTVRRGGGPEKATGGRAGLQIQTADSPEFRPGGCVILRRCFLSFSSFTLNMGATPYISAAVGHCCVTN